MKNVDQKQTYLYRVVLDTASDVNEFNRIASSCEGQVLLVGENMKVNAKSLLGTHMARIAWDELFIEADFDCYQTFRKFID